MRVKGLTASLGLIIACSHAPKTAPEPEPIYNPVPHALHIDSLKAYNPKFMVGYRDNVGSRNGVVRIQITKNIIPEVLHYRICDGELMPFPFALESMVKSYFYDFSSGLNVGELPTLQILMQGMPEPSCEKTDYRRIA